MTPQKISSCLWFDDQAEEAANYYVSIFKNSDIVTKTPYHVETPSNKPKGSVMTVGFELEGYSFTALNGGPYFTPNPSISFFVISDTEDEVHSLWENLSKGGTPLMPLDSYPFSKKYGWVQDKFGVSWQLILANDPIPQKIMPSLLFVGDVCGKAEEAINFYTSVFDDSKIKEIARYGAGREPDAEGTVMYADFELEGQLFAAMDSAQDHNFNFNEALSLIIHCQTQDEIDYYWKKLSAVPQAEQCGWLKDQYGVSWQVVPRILPEMIRDKNADKARRVMEAMLQMKKLDIKGLEQATK